MSALYTNAELIRKNDPLALRYFNLWVCQADNQALENADDAVSDNFEAIGETAHLAWPSVDGSKARVPFITDCLQYLRGGSAIPESISSRLASGSWDALTGIGLAACTGRGDRGAAIYLSRGILRHVDAVESEHAICAYYEHIGVSSDLPLLERYARRAYPDSGRLPTGLDWQSGIRLDVEDVILQIRLKAIFDA